MSPRAKPVRPVRAPAGVDRFDWEIVCFMLSWAPYGGASEEDVFSGFGMTGQQLNERFAAIVSRLTVPGSLRLNRSQRELLKRAADHLAQNAGQQGRRKAASPGRREGSDGLASTEGAWMTRRGLWHWVPRSPAGATPESGRTEPGAGS